MIIRRNWPFYLLFFVAFPLVAQEGKITNHIYEGNQQAAAEAYPQAEKAYRKALSLAPEKPTALYNLANTHYRDKQFDEASQRFFQTQKFASEKHEKHKAFHNMGNVYMQKKEYEKAVEAYKNALRNNPADDETRYNYALAKELLEKEQQKQDQNQDDQQQNDDQNDDDQKEDQEQDQQQEGDQKEDNKDQENKEGDEGEDKNNESEPDKEGENQDDPKNNPKAGDQKPPEKKQPPKPRPGMLSPEQVKSLLEAMNNQEKKVQDKVNAEKVKGVPVRGKKDW